jgi:hypothetical protein
MRADFHLASLFQNRNQLPFRRTVPEGNGNYSSIALNVRACEVSCRAGTIKCSRCLASLAPIRPAQWAGSSVPPLIPPRRDHSADITCGKCTWRLKQTQVPRSAGV